MSNPHELIYINDIHARMDAAVARFFEQWKHSYTTDKDNYPLTLSLIDWLDLFQAWLDTDEFELPATLHPEIVAGDPEAKVVPLFRYSADGEI